MSKNRIAYYGLLIVFLFGSLVNAAPVHRNDSNPNEPVMILQAHKNQVGAFIEFWDGDGNTIGKIKTDGSLWISKINVSTDVASEVQPLFTVGETTDTMSIMPRVRVREKDVKIEDKDRGVILKAQNDTSWLIWIGDNGSLFTTQVAASPEVSMAVREQRMQVKRTKMKKLKNKKSNQMSIEQRIKRIEDWLNLE